MEIKQLIELLRSDSCVNCPLVRECNDQYASPCLLSSVAADRLEQQEKQLVSASAERQATFRLGQMDMQAAAVDALLEAADGTYGLITASLIEASEIVRKLGVMDG